MSGFKALNIESDDESDIEIDDTKELQIEEALKLYQTALKYHAEGPGSFDLAAEAYEQLFQSDIFKYPESQTELQRIELYGPTSDSDDVWSDGAQIGAVVPAGGLEAGPSTLPQVLHLSHKNYAQFKLEHLTARLDTFHLTLSQILSDAATALDHFMAALDKDDTDLDLWRRTASVGEMLDSKRVARFCLEAVLEGDDEGLGNVLSLPGLEESLAGEKLRDLVVGLEDELSLLQSPLSTGKRKVLSKMLKKRLSTYHEITVREKALRQNLEPPESRETLKTILDAPSTWAEVGDALIRLLTAQRHGTGSIQPATALAFDLSSAPKVKEKVVNSWARPQTTGRDPPALNVDTEQPIAGEQASATHKESSTAQPQVVAAEDNTQTGPQPPAEGDTTMVESPTITLPTRKRSGDAAGLNDGSEEGRAKVKRTRTRESTTADDSRQAIIDANLRWEYEQQINEIQAADDWMFETVGNLFERVGVIGFEAGRNVRQELQSPGQDDGKATNGVDHSKEHLKLAKMDLQAWLTNYSDQLVQFLTVGGEGNDLSSGRNSSQFGSSTSNSSGSKAVSRPPLMPDDGVLDFLQKINDDWLLMEEVAWEWIRALLRPQEESHNNTYNEYLWPEHLKTTVVRTLVNFDESLFDRARDELEISKSSKNQSPFDATLADIAETIFELHLDVFCLIKEPNSGVDDETIAAQRDRLHRWSELAREAMQSRSLSKGDLGTKDELDLRFLWATTFHIAASSDVTQDHVLECMNDLRAVFVAADEPTIQLQNNAIIPELSIAALDKEISKLTTRDFFLKVTTQDQQDPVAMIESLEPLLTSLDDHANPAEEAEEVQRPVSMANELIRFLQSSDISVRLLLWQKLRDAYERIDYTPKVVSCYLEMIRMILNELATYLTPALSQHDRQVLLLKCLRQIQDMTKKLLPLVHKSERALECIDEAGLRSAVNGFGEVLQLLQVVNVFEDSIRVGQSHPPSLQTGQAAPSFTTVTALVHEMQLNIWVLLYSLLKDAVFQFHDLFPNQDEDRFDFLRSVHRNLGLRGICGGSNKIFVRMLKDEFVEMTHIEGYDSEQAQVLYDLYGLNCFLNPNYELMEHNCTHDAFVEKSVALQAVDLLLQQASKLPMKDLAKHSIKDTIERVHGLAPRKKPTDAIMRNREVYRSFLRSPINPLDLYSCLKGQGNQLAIYHIPKDDALLASRGWFFLMGHIALAKFRSQKRTAPTPTEDVDIAIAFFMQDLEYSMDNWETWFRLGQAYDTKIEENVVWSAEKLNNSMSELVQLQRAAIHCYTMATALAYRSADLSYETSEKMTELFSDFAMRLYASSRPPFDGEPFKLDDIEKFFSTVQGVGKGRPFEPLHVYTAWKLAKTFFQKALRGKPHSWMLHFMLGKCLWKMKMFKHDSPIPGRATRPSSQQVLNSFIRAIELIPDEKRKDSREKREPVLEPHYKLVSIVHKLLNHGHISLEQAKEALENTPYASTVKFPEELGGWVAYVLGVLKALRATDKSNWHHRMVDRAARIVYDDLDSRLDDTGRLGANRAKNELTQQMFTKTMVLQVWRPDSERAGRHFVYTARYTRFFVEILEKLKDRGNLEMLARRVRRRPHDVFEHSSVWQEICMAYIHLLRAYSQMPEGLETSTFSNVVHEDFLARKEPLEKWMQAQETGASPALDALREVQELKKINQSLMKPGAIDDLIGDCYAHLYNTVGQRLWDEQRRIKEEEEARRPPPVASPPRNPMMSLTHLMNIDGSNDSPAAPPLPSQPPGGIAAQPDQAPARRKIGVGRREIRTTAEACFLKTAAAATASSSSKTTASLPRVQVVIDSSRETRAGDISAETSAPGSIHDSADDESELSELEEEGDDESNSPIPIEDTRPRPMFPGLASEMQSREASEGLEGEEEEAETNGDVPMGYRAVNAVPTVQASEHSAEQPTDDKDETMVP